MPTVQTNYEHISLDEKGVPIISGTTAKVIEVVLEKIAYGWSAEEIHFQHPYLTLEQIYSALAYYSDHQEELDKDIEQRIEHADHLYRSMGHSPLFHRLKTKGLI